MKRKLNSDKLISGSILTQLLKLALPMIVAFIFVTSYQFVDRYFVSQLGDVATAAIGMAFILQMVVLALGIGIGSGVNSFIARNLGAQKQEVAEKTIVHAIYIALIVGSIIAIIGLFGQRLLFSTLGAEGELLTLILAYMTLILIFTPINLMTMIANSIYQGWGDTISPMKFMLVGNILNLILDPLLIFGLFIFPELGIRGAATATVLGRIAAFLYFGYKLFIKHEPTKISFKGFKYDASIVKGVLQVGLPSSVSQLMTSVAMGFIFWVLDPFGSDARAAYTIVFTYDMVVFLPAIGIAQAVKIMTGHNFGAGKLRRLNRVFFTGIGTAFVIMTISVCVVFFFPRYFAGIFAQDPAVLEITATALKITVLGHIFSGVYLCASSSFMGLGLGRQYLAANILRLYLLQMPFAYFGAKWMGLEGVWYGILFTHIISAVVLLAWHQWIHYRKILTGKIQAL